MRPFFRKASAIAPLSGLGGFEELAAGAERAFAAEGSELLLGLVGEAGVVEDGLFAGDRHPGEHRIVAKRQAGLGIDVREELFAGLDDPLSDPGIERRRAAAAGWQNPQVAHAVAGAEAARGEELECDVNTFRFQGGDQMIEFRQGVEVERPGIVSGVVEQALARSERGVEMFEANQVDPRATPIRSARTSARSRGRKAAVGIRLAPKKRARRPLEKNKRPSRTTTLPFLPAGASSNPEASRALSGSIAAAAAKGCHSSVSSAM